MNRWITGIAAILIGIVMSVGNAEAARVGGGKSSGTQRDGVSQRSATPHQNAPAQAAPSAANPAAAAAAPGAAAAAAKPGMGRWLAPLAGLAIGMGLASMFGEQMGSIMMALLIGLALMIAVVFIMRMFARNRAAPTGSLRTAPAAAEAGFGTAGAPAESPTLRPLPRIGEGLGASVAGSGAATAPSAASAIPAGFNVDAFLHHAKKSFVDLQAANDRGDLEALREMSTIEMFDALKRDFDARGGAAQQVEVQGLRAELLEVVTEGTSHWASVRFSGSLREDPNVAPSAFEEIWNLQKPANGSAGWLLAGVQQVN